MLHGTCGNTPPITDTLELEDIFDADPTDNPCRIFEPDLPEFIIDWEYRLNESLH